MSLLLSTKRPELVPVSHGEFKCVVLNTILFVSKLDWVDLQLLCAVLLLSFHVQVESFLKFESNTLMQHTSCSCKVNLILACHPRLHSQIQGYEKDTLGCLQCFILWLWIFCSLRDRAKAYISFWFGLEMMKTWQSYLESGPGWTQLSSEAGLWWWRSLDCFIFLMMWYPQKYPLLTSNCDALHCVINLQCW